MTPNLSTPELELPEHHSELTATRSSSQGAARDGEAESQPHTPLAGVREAEREDGEVLVSEALLTNAQPEIANGWHRERRDGAAEAEAGEGGDKVKESALVLPHSMGSRLDKEQLDEEVAGEKARTGGVIVTLERLEDGAEGPLMELVRDRATFDQFFVAEHSTRTIEGTVALSKQALDKQEPVKDGATLTFSAGVHVLHDFGRHWRDRFPRDLTIRGGGKASTLLVLESPVSLNDTVRNLTFENCSIHTNNQKLFRAKGISMSLTLRNVRITGWDNGAGGSSLLAANGLALRAIDSEFLSGYGRAPQHSRLFDVRTNALLARFENCTLARTEVFSRIRDGATVVYRGCRIEDAMDWNSEVPSNVLLDGTSLTFLDRSQGQEPAKLDLNDLFPGWEKALR